MIDLDELLENESGIYLTEFPMGLKFYWRLLNLDEYKKFYALRNTGAFHMFYLYKKVFDKCYIGNKNLINQDMPMFIPATIGQLIMYLSGDCNTETIEHDIENARSRYSRDIIEHFKFIILSAFPTYSMEDLNKLNRVQLIDKFVQAEELLSFKIEGFKKLNVAEIIKVDPNKQIQEISKIETVNTSEENAILQNNLNIWDAADQMEKDFKPKRTKQITPEQARKLDTAKK